MMIMTDRSELDEDKENYEIEKNESINETVASIIDHLHRSSSRLSYSTFDHRWVSLSRARIEHEIKTSNVKKISKSSIWKNMIVLRSFDKRLDRFEVCTDHSSSRFSRSSSSRLFYSTFDHRWVSLSRARIERGIKTSNVRQNSKSSIWENWSFWDHLTKDLIVLKPAQIIRWYEHDRATQIKDETIKANVRRSRHMKRSHTAKIFWSEKSPSTICSEWVRKSSAAIWSWTIIIFLLLS